MEAVAQGIENAVEPVVQGVANSMESVAQGYATLYMHYSIVYQGF